MSDKTTLNSYCRIYLETNLVVCAKHRKYLLKDISATAFNRGSTIHME